MNIPLHAPIPIRLLAKSGKWLLEIERYVSVRSQLFRPRRETLEGEGAILRALSSAEEAELTDVARALMRAGSSPDRCYDVVEGAFSEAALPDKIAEARPPEERARAEEQELTRMRDQLLMLQMKVEHLRAQVTDLERGAPQTKQLAPSSGHAPVVQDSSHLAGRDLIAEDASSLAGRDLLADDSSSLAGRDLLADDEPAAAPASPAPLELGSPEANAAALDALLGGAATFTVSSADTTPGLLMIDESYFVSKMANESGESVGAVLVDGPTLKMLGAAVRKMSKADTEAELSSDSPSDTVLAGLKDLAAAMVDVVSKSSGDSTVFACDVEKLDPVELPWLFDVQKRVDLDDSLGGHVLLIAK